MMREIADPEEDSEKKNTTRLNDDASRHASKSKDVLDHSFAEKENTSDEGAIPTLSRWAPPCPDSRNSRPAARRLTNSFPTGRTD
jgi:hypothetical protein